MIPEVKETLNTAVDQMADVYPNDLVITTEAGEWSINQTEPYAIPTPEIFKTLGPENLESDLYEQPYVQAFPDNLLVFDHNGKIKDLEEQATLMVLNDINLITIDNRGKIEAFPLDGIPDGEFDKAQYLEMISNLRGYIDYVPYMLIFFVFLGTFFYYAILRLVYLISISLALLAIGYFRGLKLRMRTYYKLGMHAMTLPLTLEVVFIALGITTSVPMWFFAINLIFGISVVYHLSDTKTPAEKRPASEKKQ